MKHTLLLSAFILLCMRVLLNGSAASGQEQPHGTSLPGETYHDRPLSFEPNRGQAEDRVAFLAHGGDYTLFLTSQEAVFASLPRLPRASFPAGPRSVHKHERTRPNRPDILRMQLVGANAATAPIAGESLPGHINYLTGRDASQWRTNIPTYRQVLYPEIYHGIDLVYYGNQQRLEYDFVLRPHADPTAIAVRFAGAKRIRIDPDGALHLGMTQGELVWHRPVLYQQQNGRRREVAGRYRLCGDGASSRSATPLVRFEVGAYDPDLPLVIDPSIAYSTLLGGSQTDNGYAITVDGLGNAYVAGDTLSADLPTTAGALQRFYGGASGGSAYGDTFITKFDHNGRVAFTTYIGGSGADTARGIALSGSTICIVGSTDSPDFPRTASAYQTTPPSGTAAFVTALTADGSALNYSTYLGSAQPPGNGMSVNNANAIAVDSGGQLYITGYSNAHFPTTTGAYMANGGNNAFVAKLDITKSGAASLVYATYLGGASFDHFDEGDKIAVDSSGAAYVTGITYSFDFPTTPGAFNTDNTASGGAVVFVTKMNATGTALVYSTLLNAAFASGGIALDTGNNAYITGAAGPSLPTTAGAFQATGTGITAFVAKFNALGSALVYSTFLGNSTFGRALAVEPTTGIAYVAGNVRDGDLPTTPGAFASTYSGAESGNFGDAFLTKINALGSALLYSTYLGSAGDDVARGVAIDLSGGAYLTGSTGIHAGAPNFPTTNQTLFGGGAYDAFVTKISTARLTGLTVTPSSGTGGTVANPSLLFGQLAFDGLTAPAETASLSSSNPAVASVNVDVSLPEVALAQFPITLHPVATDTGVTLSATFGGVTLTAPIIVLAPRIASLALAPSSVVGGKTATGTVTLSAPAPTGGLAVTLTSGNPLVTVPTTVTVPADASTATFVANTNATAVTTQVTVTATSAADASGKSANLTVKPPTVTNLSVAPNSVHGGQNATGTVTISDPAPSSGIVVLLSSNNASLASGPASVTVPSGATTATFTVTTHAVAANATVTLTATFNAASATANLTLTPPDLTSLTLAPTSVKGSLTSTATVTLSDPAPSSGIVVTLSSANSAVAGVPASVTVPSGAKTATFTVTTNPVAVDTAVTLTGAFNGQTKTGTLTVKAPLVISLALNPTTVRALKTATVTVTLDAPAPTGGIQVNLFTSNASVAPIVSSVTVAAGAKTASVTVTTAPVLVNTRVLFAATLGTSNESVTLTVLPHLPFDFDNDGHNDIVFQGLNNNLVYLWFTNVLSILGGTSLNAATGPGWQIVGAGDVNGDGNPDLFLQNQTTTRVAVWYMNGTTFTGGEEISQVPPSTYKVVGCGDFNGDGKPDVLFQVAGTGQMVIWYLSGKNVTSTVTLSQVPGAGYNVVGVGDLNGDGKIDIIFQQQTTNQIVVCYMNNTAFIGGGSVASTPPAGWQLKAVEDLNGDGKVDLIFQNQSTGPMQVWFMDGLTVTGSGTMSITPPADYRLRGPR